MNFAEYLLEQIERHPSADPQDIVKHIYQAAHGAEHLLSDPDWARQYLEREFAGLEPVLTAGQRQEVLWEQISEDVCRIDLRAWKKSGMPLEWLFRMFVSSASVRSDSREVFAEYLETAEQVLNGIWAMGKRTVGFTEEDWMTYLEEYRQAGMPPVRHSVRYREAEKPAYRIVSSKYIRLLPILCKIAEDIRNDCLSEESAHRVYVIAVDGRAASGKSTLAGLLKEILGAELIQMDDFFLPPPMRTPERLGTPGGNIHYERFREEVLLHLHSPERFSYQVFDCSIGELNGECVIAAAGNPLPAFRVVEGSYSCHPIFGNYADLTVFSDVSPEEQRKRIVKRNGAEMAEIFENRWIPMEEAYFETYQTAKRADICLQPSEHRK